MDIYLVNTEEFIITFTSQSRDIPPMCVGEQ